MNDAQAIAIQLLTVHRLGIMSAWVSMAEKILKDGYIPKFHAGILSASACEAIEIVNKKSLQDEALKIAKEISKEYGVQRGR